MVVQKRQTPAQTHAAQALGVHPAGIPAEAEEQEDHGRTPEPDVSRVPDPTARSGHFDRVPGVGVVHAVPDELDVLDGGLPADDVDLQRH